MQIYLELEYGCDTMTYNGSPITWARAKKMKEALHMLIQVIWA